ncbi:hypothetical protein AN964_13110 [Heyndrickxia shackletonii]|uniref:Uncharacterized protein n=1 Tax=Heyndrickxia shackletonii TaxID=157838 RepID=A0A0Q3WXQ5_9BACI|nr:hypothetical protein [Heyndrickxia shackletonii]KQL54339.1 hypothetical protein AN964_13110 [Heyndrickxia shackletonii]MBB2480199.1 hypothetical protein [Bacillus sp. APMAM]NEZ01437.1 hypothetical protein [Heyndrickxia shackletonii]RTZ56403.1 hypothetical protein EKO25_07990 [Bacillus sp. SAJ1]
MSIPSNETKQKRTLWQWISFITPYVYSTGIVFIIGWMLSAAVINGIETVKAHSWKAFFLPTNENTHSNEQSWVNVIAHSIIDSNLNNIIFRGIFFLLIWVTLFLMIPVAFTRLKRFKLFNFEFEVEDKEQAAIQTVEINGGKAKLMAYLTSDDASGKLFDFLDGTVINYQEALMYFLDEIQAGYRQHFNASFSYMVQKEGLPPQIEDLSDESRETGEAVLRNKTDNDNLLKKNYLVYYFCLENNTFTTVLSSYQHQFDIFDKYLIELLHNIINKNVENIEYMVALTSEDEENETA